MGSLGVHADSAFDQLAARYRLIMPLSGRFGDLIIPAARVDILEGVHRTPGISESPKCPGLRLDSVV